MTTLTPQDFVAKWKRAEARERQSVQEHFIDLCRLVGHETPMQADPTGKQYAFEMGAAKTSGGAGWADVAKLGYFGWEYKGTTGKHTMSKQFIAILLLVILTSACNQPVNVTTLPSVTPIANTIDPTPSATPTPLFVTATEDLPVTVTGSACAAPEPRVAIGQEVLVTVEDWDKLKLRSEAAVSADNILMELDQYSQLKILEGPVCVYSAETDYSYWFWKVVVIPTGEIGWVAEGDYTHYFIQKY